MTFVNTSSVGIAERSKLVHARPGKQRADDRVFFEAWGPELRNRFISFQTRAAWMTERPKFIQDACSAFGTPTPSRNQRTEV